MSNSTKIHRKPERSSVSKWIRRSVLIFLSLVLVGIITLTALLFIWSPGNSKAILDENGDVMANSLSEKVFIEVNGTTQGMFIKSTNIDNPVLLFLHGGPGMPEYFLTKQYPTGLENDFTVVWWDRRGAGLSFSPKIPRGSQTIEQSIQDTITVTNYLRERFKRKFICWGIQVEVLSAFKWQNDPPIYIMPTSEWRRWFTRLNLRSWLMNTCCQNIEKWAILGWCDCWNRIQLR